ncbi:MAG: DUF4157 domain-containing protein [Chloroflexi bacterium]|nr:DUF4157 domain-containing protein [Chloroflexota bacterium]
MNTRAITKVKRNASHSAIPARNLAPQRRFDVLQVVDEAATSAERLRSGLQAEPRFRYDFSQTPVNFSTQAAAQQVMESCPLALSSPRACPFGGACHTCSPRVQAKLTVGQVGDKFEQEADRFADAIMRTSDPVDQRELEEQGEEGRAHGKPTVSEIKPLIQRQVEVVEEEEKDFVQARAISGQSPQLETQIKPLKSGGQPLDRGTRRSMERHFGHDFSQVRIHTGDRAADAARTLNARAFTLRNHIVFGAGQYAPKTKDCRHLLAHELTHTLQQAKTRTNSTLLQMKSQGEKEAKVYVCSRDVALSSGTGSFGRHSFFRIGSIEPKDSDTYSLMAKKRKGDCYQGIPKKNWPSDKHATDASCELVGLDDPSCIEKATNTYNVGHYCTWGPNCNTFVGYVARRCGIAEIDPPGWTPGISDNPPPAGTFAPSPINTFRGCEFSKKCEFGNEKKKKKHKKGRTSTKAWTDIDRLIPLY